MTRTTIGFLMLVFLGGDTLRLVNSAHAQSPAEEGRSAPIRDEAVAPAQAVPAPSPVPAVRPPSPGLPTTPPARPPSGPATIPGPRAAPAPRPASPPELSLSPSPAVPPGTQPTFDPGFGTMAGFSSGGTFQMIGDASPGVTFAQVPTVPTQPGLPTPFPPGQLPRPPRPGLASALAPSVRGFKIAENQSPQPQDRVFFSFNFYANVNAAVNRRLEAPVNDLRVYREIFGIEKTFDEGNGSIGLRLPLNTLTANSAIRGNFARPGGTSTALGDLSIFAKYVLKRDPRTGSLLSAGLMITPTTGPGAFAGSKFISTVHSTSIQPFLGYIWNRESFYLHGFLALDTPSSVRDVTMVYNDVGIGYFLFRNPDPGRFLTAVAPTFEVHVNTPLTHRDPFNARDPAGTPDIVNLTYGLNLEFYRTSLLTFGFVTPVTGPRPFDYEALLLFNVRFGRSRAAQRALPPVLGG